MSNSLDEILLDTTVQIDILRPSSQRKPHIEYLLRSGAHFYTSAISYAEVCSGLRSQEEASALAFLNSMTLFPVTRTIAQRGGFLQRTLRQRGLTIELPDILIAATALEYELTILTANVRDFRNTGVRLLPLSELK